MLLDALFTVKATVPDLEVVFIGEGEQRGVLEQMIRDHDAGSWVRLVGRVSDAELVEWYQRAWLVSSMSLAEGWGMTITEAAGCGTPAVVSRITGHADAVWEGRSGLLVGDVAEYVAATSGLLRDPNRLEQLRDGARERAASLSWSAVAVAAMESLVADARARPARRAP